VAVAGGWWLGEEMWRRSFLIRSGRGHELLSPPHVHDLHPNLSHTIPSPSRQPHSLNARAPPVPPARRRTSPDPAAAMTDSAASTPERVPAASSIPSHIRRVVTLPPRLTGPAAGAQVRDPETIEWLLEIEFARVVAFESSLSSSRPNSRSSARAASSDAVRWSSPTETTLATGKTLRRGTLRALWQLGNNERPLFLLFH
jgi:hypothetical protein